MPTDPLAGAACLYCAQQQTGWKPVLRRTKRIHGVDDPIGGCFDFIGRILVPDAQPNGAVDDTGGEPHGLENG